MTWRVKFPFRKDLIRPKTVGEKNVDQTQSLKIIRFWAFPGSFFLQIGQKIILNCQNYQNCSFLGVIWKWDFWGNFANSVQRTIILRLKSFFDGNSFNAQCAKNNKSDATPKFFLLQKFVIPLYKYSHAEWSIRCGSPTLKFWFLRREGFDKRGSRSYKL